MFRLALYQNLPDDRTQTVLVDALIRGFQDGADILTLSLGGADGWTESSSSVVASAIARTGRIVTIAAGNDVRTTSPSLLSESVIPNIYISRAPPALGTPLVPVTVSM